MYKYSFSLSVFALSAFALISEVHAEVLASGNIYGGSSQVNAYCYLFNAGNAAVTVSSIEVKGHNDTGPATVITNGCIGTLAAGMACQLKTQAATQKAYSCKAVITPEANLIRGHIDLRNINDSPLVHGDMR